MKIGEVRKRFKMVWGSFMEAEGFVYKGGCYYRHEPENGIVKAVEVDNIADGHDRRIWFNAMSYMDCWNPKHAARLYELDIQVGLMQGTLPKKGLWDGNSFELDDEVDERLENRLRSFQKYVYPQMERVHDLSMLTEFTKEIFRFYDKDYKFWIGLREAQIWRSLKIHEEMLLEKCVAQQKDYLKTLREEVLEEYPTEELERENATDSEKAFYRNKRKRLLDEINCWDKWLEIIDIRDQEKIEQIIRERTEVGRKVCEEFFNNKRRKNS